MPFVPAANTATAEVIYTWDGQRVENTLAFANSFAWTASSIAALAAAVLDWATTELLPGLIDTLELVQVETRDISTASSFVSTAVAPGGTVGGNTGDSLPNNVALCISFRSGVAGRSFRGRNYVPGIPRGEVVDNTASTTFANFVIAAYGALNSYVDPFGGSHAILSRFSGVDSNGDPIPRTVGVTTGVTAYAIVDRTVDSQRRRLPGRGA